METETHLHGYIIVEATPSSYYSTFVYAEITTRPWVLQLKYDLEHSVTGETESVYREKKTWIYSVLPRYKSWTHSYSNFGEFNFDGLHSTGNFILQAHKPVYLHNDVEL